MVASSPKVPCKTGKAQSTGVLVWLFREKTTGLPASEIKATGSEAAGKDLSVMRTVLSKTSRPPKRYQEPSLLMPIRTKSNLLLSRAFATFLAERIETSCSEDFPPKISATVFFMPSPQVLLQVPRCL